MNRMKYLMIAFIAFGFVTSIFAQRFDLSRKDSLNILLSEHFSKRDSLREIRKNESFPDFTVVSIKGDTIFRSMLEGKIVLMNFWFEGCTPCIAELDDLSKLYHKFKENLSFMFLSFTVDPKEHALKCAEKYNLPFPIYPIDRKECSGLTVNAGFPTTIILNQSGKTAFSHEGGAIEKNLVIKQIQEYETVINDLLKDISD